MNYSNTYDVIIVINGPPTYLPSHQVSEMNISPNVFLFDTDLKLPPSAFPPLQLTTPDALWDRNLGLIFISLLFGERKKYP